MQRRLAWIAAAILTALLGSLLFSSPALAASPAASVRAQALRLQAQIDTLNTQMEVVVERYDAGRTKLADEAVQVAAIDRGLAFARYELAIARRELALQVVAMYKQQPVQFLDVVLAIRSFGELLSQVEFLGRVGQQSSGLVAGIDRQRASIARQQAQLLAERRQAQRLVTQAAREKQTIAVTLARREATLGHAQAKVKRLMSQMQAARLRAAARAAAAAEAGARRAALTAPKTAPRSPGSPRPSSSSSAPQPVRPSPARVKPSAQPTHKTTPKPKPRGPRPPRPTPSVRPAPPGLSAAVTIARRYLGVPYVWGGASPAGFDCSGLVMYVFAKLGISLPHNAAMQFADCTPVPLRSLTAGDLVFFGSSPATIHHVGIYVGNGVMIDAPYTGVDVRYDLLSSDFYSGGRP